MWDPENFPGADHVPWQLLIRARYQYEVDAVIASVILRNATVLGNETIAKELGAAAAKAVALSREVNGRKKVAKGGAAYSVVAEFDDWCGTRWPRWPGPGPRPRSEEVDPIVVVFADRALDALTAIASPQLRDGLAPVLDNIAANPI